MRALDAPVHQTPGPLSYSHPELCLMEGKETTKRQEKSTATGLGTQLLRIGVKRKEKLGSRPMLFITRSGRAPGFWGSMGRTGPEPERSNLSWTRPNYPHTHARTFKSSRGSVHQVVSHARQRLRAPGSFLIRE